MKPLLVVQTIIKGSQVSVSTDSFLELLIPVVFPCKYIFAKSLYDGDLNCELTTQFVYSMLFFIFSPNLYKLCKCEL